MFNKIIIRNVGVLRAFDTPNAPRLAQLSLFYGRNGRGKSTLTSVLRAAREGCSQTVLARQSLGNGGIKPEVRLIAQDGNVQFTNGRWQATAPIEVFDATFINDNIYAGELVELAHDRGLFSIIIGEQGVGLADHLERFNVIAKGTTIKLKLSEAALVEDKPTDMKLDEFFALPHDPDLMDRLAAAELTLKRIQQADKVAALSKFQSIAPIPLLSDADAVMDSTVDSIESSARERLLLHFKRFSLDKKAEEWISYGLNHIHEDSCPLCARDNVDGEGMVTLYSQIFGETYKNHLGTIRTFAATVDRALGEESLAQIVATISANVAVKDKWSEYLRIDHTFPDMGTVLSSVREAHEKAKFLCDKKRAAPVDQIGATDELIAIQQILTAANEAIESYNAVVEAANSATSQVVSDGTMTVQEASTRRDNVRKRIARHDRGVQKRVKAYFFAKKRDERAKRVRTFIQAELKRVNEAASLLYHQRVTHYLTRFKASFTISKIKNNMQGNAGQTDYSLVIKGESVARQRGRQTEAIPSFRNTLSSGDKTTLALAFFLAKLDHDSDLSKKILVIDDPLGSHDRHRRRETVAAIKELCGRCRQVIVLSHDEFLLREIQGRCRDIPSEAFQIEYEDADEWSVASAADLNWLCRTSHARMIEDIRAFVEDRRGDPNEVVLKVRQILETHYRRSFSGYFTHEQNLGSIIKAITDEGSTHPCFSTSATAGQL